MSRAQYLAAVGRDGFDEGGLARPVLSGQERHTWWELQPVIHHLADGGDLSGPVVQGHRRVARDADDGLLVERHGSRRLTEGLRHEGLLFLDVAGVGADGRRGRLGTRNP